MNDRRTTCVVMGATVMALVALLLIVSPVSASGPPVTFPGGDWPWYAQEEITVHPEPPLAHHPTQLCAEVVNHTTTPQTVTLKFSVSNFGIGVPFTPVGQTVVVVPPSGKAKGCVTWVPPRPGPWCIQVRLVVDGFQDQISQRNIDIWEPLVPGQWHNLVFPVGPQPSGGPITFTIKNVLPGWQVQLDPPNIPHLAAHTEHTVTLKTKPPLGVNLGSRQPIADIEGFLNGESIGGFRKIDWPPVPLHRPKDPLYAESEISITPYPPRAGEPTQVCVELRNLSATTRTVQVQFSWAHFGIGLPFHPINGPRVVTIPPHSVVKECINWIPRFGGRTCIRVELEMDNHHRQWSQRNIDVGEPLKPGKPHSLPFQVGNDTNHPLTITLRLVPHLPNWNITLSPTHILPDVQPGQTREVTLTVTPPGNQPLPEDGTPIVDVEGHAEGRLIGGFRKIFRPPVPIHRPRDPIYAESEIGVYPYPAIAGVPTKLSVEVHNPTPDPQMVTATFSVAHFGIGLPFTKAGIAPNPITLHVPPRGRAKGHVVWTPPPVFGRQLFCVQVDLQMPDGTVVWSRRNIDVGEILVPRGQGHPRSFPVANPNPGSPMTITLGLINHRPGWGMSVVPSVLPNVGSNPVMATLWITPAADAPLGDGRPVADVEAFINHKLIGGFRKIDRPPIPIHKPHERIYAETDLTVTPDPPVKGVPAQVCTEVQNTSPVSQTVIAEFGWAKFGFGIPFTTTNMVPPTRTITVSPYVTATACVFWTPTITGSQCVIVRLRDPLGQYPEQKSRRNVRVVRPRCRPMTFTFTVYNDRSSTVEVDIGVITLDVPEDWQVSTDPPETLTLGPYSEGEVTVTVKPTCSLAAQEIYAMQEQAGSVPTIDVEGYIDGELAGGISIQFSSAVAEENIYLPLILKQPGK